MQGDPARIHQVVLNLTSNALKFTEHGSVVVDAVTTHLGTGRSLLRISVRDTGIGIAPESLDKLFQPFTQADASMTRRYGGAGLGLSISKRLVESMGGRIGAASTPGQGSEFWFEIDLPRVEVEPVEAKPAEGKKNETRTAFPKPGSAAHAGAGQILVVEDNLVNQTVARRLLERLGYSCQIADNGCEAIRMFDADDFVAILMDCQMPEMDGYEATVAIRTRESDSRIPIIAMTANASHAARDHCFESGMDDFLSKPAQLSDLRRVLERWVTVPLAPIA